MIFSKNFFLSLLTVFILTACQRFDLKKLFSEKKETTATLLFEENLEEEPVKEEALDRAKKSVWEVSLYLNFQINKIDISEKGSRIDINIENNQDLIPLGHGSGFFISPSLMVTNFHVIDKANKHIEIISNRDSENSNEELIINQMKVLKVSAIYDLALLESETESPYFLNVKESAVDLNRDSFFLLGYPDNRFILSSVQYTGSHLNRKFIYFNRNADLGKLTGASGGPIIDQNGKVIAVNQSGNDGMVIGISNETLNNFLNGNNRDCSKIPVADCLKEEWLFLDEAYKKADPLAKFRVSVNNTYENWSNKTEKLNELIINRQKLTEIEAEVATAMERYNRERNRENIDLYNETLKQYQDQVSLYNEIVSELNKLFF